MSGGKTLGTDDAAENLREAVRNRRGRLRLSAEDAAALGDVPLGTWSGIEQGKSKNPKPPTLGGIDVAMRWPPMTAYRVLIGDMSPADAVALPLNRVEPSDDDDHQSAIHELVETMALLGPSERRAVVKFAEQLARAS